MKDESKFVQLWHSASECGVIHESTKMSRAEVLDSLEICKDRSLIDLWMQKARRGEYFIYNGLIVVCVSGRRSRTPGMRSEQLMSLVNGEFHSRHPISLARKTPEQSTEPFSGGVR